MTCPGFEPGACIYLATSTTESSQLLKSRQQMVKDSHKGLTTCPGFEPMKNESAHSLDVWASPVSSISWLFSPAHQLGFHFRQLSTIVWARPGIFPPRFKSQHSPFMDQFVYCDLSRIWYGLMFQLWVKFLELAISDLSRIWTWRMHNISCSLNHWVKSMLQDNNVKYGPRYKIISWP